MASTTVDVLHRYLEHAVNRSHDLPPSIDSFMKVLRQPRGTGAAAVPGSSIKGSR
jgi:hypothetical protein